MVVVFDPDINFIGNSLNILSIGQRIKRRYKEKARLKQFGDLTFYAFCRLPFALLSGFVPFQGAGIIKQVVVFMDYPK